MFKFGYVAVLGKPNAGKSTLVNALVGEKVSIVSYKPQTTRNMINGIVNGEDYQVVFVDTPGIQHGKSGLARYMARSVEKAVEFIDAIVYMFNGEKIISDEEIKDVQALAENNKVIVVLNKQDSVDPEIFLEKLKKLGGITSAVDIVPMSVHKRINTDFLLQKLVSILPEGECGFDQDMYTDSTLRFMCSEIIREKTLYNLDKEIPYGMGVVIDKFDEREDGICEIAATLYCEKQAHKSIIIGKKGAMLKKIGSEARADIEKLLDCQVYLTLWVKVKPDWRDKEYLLNEFGYNKKYLK